MRNITIKCNVNVPVQTKALERLVKHYYKGKYDLSVSFDNRLNCCGYHSYDSSCQKHTIELSLKWCQINHARRSYKKYEMEPLDDIDTTCKIIAVLLHEIKHAMQCEKNPIRYARCDDDRHPAISNPYLGYLLSELEAEADGWALLHFNRALELYQNWCNE